MILARRETWTHWRRGPPRATWELLGMKMPALIGKTVSYAQWNLPGSVHIKCLNHKAQDAGMIWPDNWTICQQNPAPGAEITKRVILTVIKRGKVCTVNH